MWGHPSSVELFVYAEGLVRGQGISTATARHVKACEVCAREVGAIRSSLAFAASAETVKPAEVFTAQVLAAARQTRHAAPRCRSRAAVTALRGLAFVAGVVVLSTVYFPLALGKAASPEPAVRNAPSQRLASSGPSPEEIRKATAQIQTLTAAMGSRSRAPRSLREWQQARAVLALDADLAAARAALQRNPGCERANRIMDSNIRRQAQALKTLYIERSL